MDITDVRFIKSSASVNDCPAPSYPEYAFAGRSNSGKSSLINMITDRVKLAKTSATPGKTRLINHFLVNGTWYLVDLPGYGYAKVAGSMRRTFPLLMKEYLQTRENLACLFLLVDSRHEPLSNDLAMIEWLGQNKIPFVLVFTKADKVSPAALDSNIGKYNRKMLESWESVPPVFRTSSLKHSGRAEILDFIGMTNSTYNSVRL
jgi:GTP-binding protein